MRRLLPCFLFFCLLDAASARSKDEIVGTAQINNIFDQLYAQSSAESELARKQAMEKAEVAYQRRMFYGKAKHFVDLWTKMTKQVNQNTFDVKLARQVSRAFHDLESSGGWPAQVAK